MDNKIYVDLNAVKQHLNIDCWFSNDDYILLTYIQIAQDVVEKNIDCSLSSLEDENGDLPNGLVGAILLYIGLLYDNREAVQRGGAMPLPLGFEYILDNYRNYNPSNKQSDNNNNKCCCK